MNPISQNKNNASGKTGLTSRKKAIVIITIILLVGIIAFSWNYLPYLKNSHTGNQGSFENSQYENESDETVLKYKFSFEYLDSKDDGPVEKVLFLVFPCPKLDNKVILETENMEIDQNPRLENIKYSLWTEYENEGENIHQLEIENNNIVELVKPRNNSPSIHKPWLQNTSHGIKVWFQFSMAPEAHAFYQGEKAKGVATFKVPKEKVDEVNLKDNFGGVFFGANAYNMDGYRPIHYQVDLSIYRRVDGDLKTIKKFSATAENLSRYTWIKLN